MRLEVERRYRAAEPGVLERLATRARLGRAALGPARTVDELDRYLDTPDGRLAAAGWACRLRTRGARTIVSLKGPPERTDVRGAAVIDAALHRRPELEGPAAPAASAADPRTWPASAARDRLLELSGGPPLVERLALAQRRIERAVGDPARPLAVLSLDRVVPLRAGTHLGELLVAELEERRAPLDAHEAALLASAAGALDAEPGLEPEPRTKLERALALAAARAGAEA